jgi:hypothetical protein
MAHLMEILMNGAMLVEAVLLSFLLALWLAWLAMRGVFCLMPVTVRPATVREARQIPPMLSGRDVRARREAA